jgi:nucleoside-diphosphate-sugar epimerase
VSTCLVTGAGGFVGRHLVAALLDQGHRVRAVTRTPGDVSNNVDYRAIGDLSEDQDWSGLLNNVDAVVHLAARVHVMHVPDRSETDVYRRINVDATSSLAAAASIAGVREFIFVSTVKVLGERTIDRPFDAGDPPDPQDDYARSKWAAEQALHRISAATGMPVSIVRPPLVYGPGVGANFLNLLELADRGMPLPFAHIGNSRSMISVWNLCDFLVRLVETPGARDRTFLVSDGIDVSTDQLLSLISRAMGRPPRLFYLPKQLLLAIAAVAGRKEEVRRLQESLVVDISANREQLNWTPPVPIQDGLRRTVEWYRRTKC